MLMRPRRTPMGPEQSFGRTSSETRNEMGVSSEKRGRIGWVGCSVALSIAFALLIVSQGCGGSDTPAPAGDAGTEAALEEKKVAPAKASTEPQAEYRYDPSNKPDPFQPFIRVRKATDGKESPLQRFDLEQLNLTAVIWSIAQPKAMVEDPSGRSHMIQIGTDIGKNRGTVTEIADQEVQVLETYVDYLGHETEKNVTLRIVKTDLYGEES